MRALVGDIAVSAATNSRVRVLVASEVRFLRESLGELLRREAAITVSGLCGDMDELLSQVRASTADVVLLDEAFPEGATAIGRLRAVHAETLVVVIAVAETAEEIIAWAEAGVAGYVPRTAGLADIVPLIVEISRGNQPCPSDVVAGLLRRLHDIGSTNQGNAMSGNGPGAKLTAREAQIARLMAEGMSNKDIARHLNIGVTTAKTHVHNLLAKLNLQRRAQLASWIRRRRDLPRMSATSIV